MERLERGEKEEGDRKSQERYLPHLSLSFSSLSFPSSHSPLTLSLSPLTLSLNPCPLPSLPLHVFHSFFTHQPQYQKPSSGCYFPPLQIYSSNHLQIVTSIHVEEFTMTLFFIMDTKMIFIIDNLEVGPGAHPCNKQMNADNWAICE